MSFAIADVGPPTAHCYTGPDDPENFVHVWTIADFENKMKNSGYVAVVSDNFHIGDTQWRLMLFPNGVDERNKGLGV